MAYDENEIVYRKGLAPADFTPEEKDLVYDYRYLDDDGKRRVPNFLKYERGVERERKTDIQIA